MYTIGLLGGMSWESTVTYYSRINRQIKKKLGGFNSAKIILNSVNFEDIENLMQTGDWDKITEILIKASKILESAGADFIVICTNTIHKLIPQLQTHINIPFLHIADAIGEELVKNGIKKAGLLGTRFTMEEDFYKNKLTSTHKLDIIIPDDKDRKQIDRIIFEELVHGFINPDSRKTYINIINKLQNAGCEAVILGCTEIGSLIKQGDTNIPLYDTALIHADKAAELALKIESR